MASTKAQSVSQSSSPAKALSPALTRHQFDRLAIAFGACLLAYAIWLPLTFTLATAAVVIVRRWLITQHLRAWPGWVRLPLLILLLLAVRSEFNGLGKTGGSAMLVGLLALKMAESERRRDALLVVTITLFLIAMAFLFQQGMLYTLYMLVPTLLCFWALNELHAHPGQALPNALAMRRVALRTLKAMAYALPLTIVLWLFVPRLQAPLWGKPDVSDEATTGLSGEMRPGDMAELLVDDRPAMRARFSGRNPDPSEMYWRGPVMWRFDGETWSSRQRWMRGVELDRSKYQLPAPNLEYEVMLEPTDRPWLFLLDLPSSIDTPAKFTMDFQVVSENAVSSLLHYRGSSSIGASAPLSPYPRSEREWGLGLPPQLNPRAAALAQQWRLETGGDAEQLVQRALSHFRNELYYYSLETWVPISSHQVDEFLFDQRVGYCQHYASSFVVLMRAAGVPARVVTGYQGGYYNIDGFVIVRNSDAHAWAEVLIPGRGWVRVDPTAAVSPDRVDPSAAALFRDPNWETGNWLTRLKMGVDAVGTWWNQAVLAFDAKSQQSLMAQLGLGSGWEQRAMVLIGALFAAGAIGALWMWAPWRRRSQPLLKLYARFERLLRKHVAPRPLNMGALAYAKLVGLELPAASAAIMAFTQTYLKARFQADAGAPPPLAELKLQLTQIRSELQTLAPR